MTIQSLADVNAAFAEGRWHTQRFVKNAGTATALQWLDPTFASGQPAYDAHVGAPLAFTPAIAQKNDAIYFPGINAGQSRHLISATMQSNQATFNGPASVQIFDLLGFYPLIDGDSADAQEFDNTLALPRYAAGKGVQAVMVNHVAPAISGGVGLIEYTDADDVDRSVTLGVPLNGVNLVCSGVQNTAALNVGPLVMSMEGPGIKQINRITYTLPPGGLHCIYLIKPLGTMLLGDNLLAAEKQFLFHNGFHAPQIYDGAWISWAARIGSGTARTVSFFGDFTFAWG